MVRITQGDYKWNLPSVTHLLAKFGPQTLYSFVENEVISSWAISKQNTNTELETDICTFFSCITLAVV